MGECCESVSMASPVSVVSPSKSGESVSPVCLVT